MEAMISLGELQSFSIKLKAVERFFLRVRPDIPANELIKHIFIESKGRLTLSQQTSARPILDLTIRIASYTFTPTQLVRTEQGPSLS